MEGAIVLDNGPEFAGCLNEHWFTSLADARQIIEGWRRDYNQTRPHSSLDSLTPLSLQRFISLDPRRDTRPGSRRGVASER